MTPEQQIFNHKESRLQLVKDKMIQNYSLNYFYVSEFGKIFMSEEITFFTPTDYINITLKAPENK